MLIFIYKSKHLSIIIATNISYLKNIEIKNTRSGDSLTTLFCVVSDLISVLNVFSSILISPQTIIFRYRVHTEAMEVFLTGEITGRKPHTVEASVQEEGALPWKQVVSLPLPSKKLVVEIVAGGGGEVAKEI